MSDMSIDPKKAETLIVQGIKSFDNDPPDSAFQRGYLSALVELSSALEIKLPEPEMH